MQHTRAATASLGLLLLAPLTAAAASADVHVVDDDGGAGVAFTDIQAAVDASAEGDVVLVRSGTYAPFTVSGQGLTVIADSEQVVGITGRVRVLAVPLASAVVLRGLNTVAPEGHGLVVQGCAGSVRVEECAFEGEQVPGEYETAFPYYGAWIVGAADVALLRSSFTGGNGNNVGFFGQPYSGAHGVLAEDSTLTVVDCDLVGGWGASCPEGDTYSGAHGGSGIEINNTTLWLSGSRAWGGHGGSGDEDFDIFIGWICGDGGDGGSGLRVVAWDADTFTYLASHVTVRDFEVFPGGGGGVICGVPGSDGLDIGVDSFAPHVVELPDGSGRGFHASSPVRGGSTWRVHAEGEVGDFFLLALGGTHLAPFEFPGSPLPLALGPPFVMVPLGAIGASGHLITPFPLGPLPAGFGGATLTLQGALLNAAQGFALELAPYGTATLLEQGL